MFLIRALNNISNFFLAYANLLLILKSKTKLTLEITLLVLDILNHRLMYTEV